MSERKVENALAGKHHRSDAHDRLIADLFNSGHADKVSTADLVKSGIFKRHPLQGNSVHSRDGVDVEFVVMHSTETKYPANAKRVINSWNNQKGDSHTGTQFVVDRDGSIYLTAYPNQWTVHINRRPNDLGVTNQNSIGIEMVRSGKQKYTEKQYAAVQRLVEYLHDRFKIERANVVSHAEVQPHNRRDPINFDLVRFRRDLSKFSQDGTPESLPKKK